VFCAGHVRPLTCRGLVALSIPNLITLARILSVPLVVWAITSGEMMIAFILFVAAGISDAVDGYLAKRFNMASELGAYLDPIADKALIVSIYVALGIAGQIPVWLVIFVASRDIMIVGAVILTWLIGIPMEVKPLLVSKLNTGAQIVFACMVLGSLAFKFNLGWALPAGMAAVAVLTFLSIAFYLAEWIRHVGSRPEGR
jgi:cardiolipin synthase